LPDLSSNPFQYLVPITSRTATADGQIMAQMLSTFSKQEESRFEAFQRSSFQADAIEEYVAACICHRHGIPRGDGTLSGAARANSAPQQQQQQQQHSFSSSASSSKQLLRQQRPRLQDLVSAPGPTVAQDVVIVVSTLAKIYAQRLVSAAVQTSNARQVRQQQQPTGQDGGDGGADDLLDLGVPVSAASTLTTDQPLEPQDVLDAYRQRVSAGLDPGFYLQGHDGISTATAVVDAARTPLAVGGGGPGSSFSQANHLGGATAVLQQHRRLAALLMQEAFDKSNAANGKVKEGAEEVRQGSEADVSMHEMGIGADTMDTEEQPETETSTTILS
jgi:hypothetical protein